MDPLFDRLESMHTQGLMTEDEFEMLKASIVELALADDINLAEEPDFVATDGRSLVDHARDACGEAEIDLSDDDAEDVADDGSEDISDD
jgi:predicted small metal-binding protein